MRKPSLDLQAFLDDQQDDGEFQGSGQFTIEHQKAARKMAKFALPRPTAWVCKFVQAAVGWSVKSVTVSQGKAYTVFHFEWPNLSDLPTENDLVSSILSSGISDDKPISSLCIGLRALVEACGLSFLVVLNDGELKPKPIYAGHHFSQMGESALLHPGFGQRHGLTISVAHSRPLDPNESMLSVADTRASIIYELDTYCYFSPIPITVDGRRIDGPIRAPAFQATDSFRPIFTGGVPLKAGEPELPLPQSFEERMLSVYTHPLRARRPYLGRQEVSVAVLLGLKLGDRGISRQTTVFWIRRGVIIDSQRLAINTTRLRCDIYLNADDLPLDLTGFKVAGADGERRLEKYLEPIAQYLGHLPLARFAFVEDRDEHSKADDEFQVEEDTRSRIKRILKGSGAGLGLALFSPALGTALTLGNLLRVYGPGNKGRDHLLKTKESEFADRLDEDQKTLRDALLKIRLAHLVPKSEDAKSQP